MCGIAGQLSAVAASVRRRAGRGDVRGDRAPRPGLARCTRPGVGLGIQRLRIIDLATGDQPIYNEDGTVGVVLNGEIYNYRELRAELRARATASARRATRR